MITIGSFVRVNIPFNHTFTEVYQVLDIIPQTDPLETVHILQDIGGFSTRYLMEIF